MVAAMIVTLGAAAHVVGGGELPVPGIMLAVLALTGMAATAATRLRLNFPAMTALLGAGQLVLHEEYIGNERRCKFHGYNLTIHTLQK
jgi:hypothetical protein